MKVDVIILGAGLFGSMAAKYLRKQGLSTLIIDNQEHYSASKCSLGVWKEGWIGEGIREKVKVSLPILDELIGIEDIDFFNQDKEEVEKFQKVNCRDILNEEVHQGEVVKINGTTVRLKSDEIFIAKKAVIIAAGFWTDKILQQSGYEPVGLDAYWGACLEYKKNVDISRYKTTSPYRQSVLVKLSEEKFLFTDGCTVKNPKLDDSRIEKASNKILQHAFDLVGTSDVSCISLVTEGYRPYGSGKGREVGIVTKHHNNIFSATGGAKSSTILSGWVAKELFEKIKGSKL